MNLCGLSPTRFRGVRHKPLGQPSLGEPAVQNLEPLFDSLIKTYYKLIEIGLTKVNGKVTFLNTKEAEL